MDHTRDHIETIMYAATVGSAEQLPAASPHLIEAIEASTACFARVVTRDAAKRGEP